MGPGGLGVGLGGVFRQEDEGFVKAEGRVGHSKSSLIRLAYLNCLFCEIARIPFRYLVENDTMRGWLRKR
jgi:hypothetical protein